MATGAATPLAFADQMAPAALPETVSADALPTVQINGVVWKTAIVGNTAYAVGAFTKARPAGTASGSSAEVSRSNILAFDVNTGALLPFAPVLNAQALTLKASPDGTKLYVGGDFTTVNGIARSKVAAFTTATGALDTTFAPSFSAQVRALAVTDSTVYVGGNFFNVNGSSRTRLAAVTRTGTLLPWKPTADDGQVEALALSPTDTSRVIVGGRFNSLDGTPQVGVGAVDSTTGAKAAWSSRPVPTRLDPKNGNSWVTDLQVQGSTVYGAADGEGGHWYDGRFAADFATGDLIWLDNCYGATYGIYPAGDAVYSVGHAHDCTSLGAFGDTSPGTWHRSLAETAVPVGTDHGAPGSNGNYSGQPVPGLLPWYPTLAAGSYTGQSQAAWSVTGNGTYLVEGGEFGSVNGVAQQGLVRFAVRKVAPNKVKPTYTPALVPTATSFAAGTARVSWPATWDADDATLQYDLYRDNGTTPVYSVKQTASSWTTTAPSVPTGPAMGFLDTGLAAGSTHTYRLKVTDPSGNSLDNMKTPAVTVASGAPSAYSKDVTTDGASAFWRLGESGTTAYDWAGFNDATAGTGVAGAAPGAIGGDTNAASTFDGTGNGVVASRAMAATPSFSIEAWVKTTSTSGGKIVGYGSSTTGTSSSYDRHVYMDGAGRIFFGLYPNAVRTVNSAAGFNDGNYHHVVATLDASAGMALYVDGKRVGRDTGTVSAQDYSGYWRIGGDNLNGWPNQPASNFLAGTIDDVAIYPSALAQTTVVQHFVDSGRPAPATTRPTDTYGKAITARDSLQSYWRLGETSGSTAADVSGNDQAGTYTGAVTMGVGGALVGVTDGSASFDGDTAAVAAVTPQQGPSVYSEELWFNTTTQRGGKLVGFGDQAVGRSNNYDRHVYMQDDGRLTFGVWTGYANLVTTSAAYNDGTWHHLVASQGADGMALYVDGALIGTNPQTSAQGYGGYFRVGGDRTWGSSSDYFAGKIDEVAIYSGVLTAAQVADDYRTGAAMLPANQAPTAKIAQASCTDLTCSVDGSGSADPDGTVSSYAWSFGDGGTAVGATASHAFAAAGSYTVQLTVTDDRGATSTATQQVSVTAPNVPPVAQLSTSCTDLTCTVDGTSSTDPDGTLVSYAWTFGDGATATGATATHTYATAGSYPVTLTVTDDRGATATASKTAVATAPAPSATVAGDSFTRTVTTGWGTADSGQAWTLSSTSAFSVADGVGSMRMAAPGSQPAATLGTVSSTSTDVQATFVSDKLATGGGTYVSVLGRKVTTSGDYQAKVRLLPNGTVAVSLVRTSAGTATALRAEAAVPGLTYTAGSALKVRLQVTGTAPTTVQVKVYAAGSAEPAAWTASATDATAALQTAGTVGLVGYLSSSSVSAPVTVRFDDLAITPVV